MTLISEPAIAITDMLSALDRAAGGTLTYVGGRRDRW